jgi:DNA-binding FadR family transcriptional regulator
VHEGLIELEARGLVTVKPRSGCTVNDYRRSGSLTLLKSLVEFSRGTPSPDILEGMLGMRVLFETETAGLAAANRTEENLNEFKALIANEQGADKQEIEKIVSLDFSFHLLTAISSGNMIYPLMLNSFKEVYTNLTRVFFREPGVADYVFGRHCAFVSALEKKDKKSCVRIMASIMKHGEIHLRKIISESTKSEGGR